MMLIIISLLQLTASEIIYKSTSKTWTEAKAECESIGSRLLTATTANSNAIQQCRRAAGTITWIGLSKTSGSWQWENEDISYDASAVNWATTEPSAGGGDCAFLRRDLTIGNTNQQCTSTFPFCCDGIPPEPSTTYQAPETMEACPRVRKEWNTATDEERQTYIDGMLALYNSGKLDKFTQQHADTVSAAQAHGSSAFLPWHRAFLLEIESQLRALGGKYECSALLYWNWAKDVEDHGYNYHDYSVLNSGLGSSGDPDDNYCVTDGAFAKSVYTPYRCRVEWYSNDNKCCLRRKVANNGSPSGLKGVAGMLNLVIEDDYYGSDVDRDAYGRSKRDGIRDNLEGGPHGNAHCVIGSCESGMYGHMGTNYSPDDPIFYLLHGYVDYLWALWQDYHDHETVAKADIASDTYYGGISGKSMLDDTLSFDVLYAQDWVISLSETTTIRDMHDITELGYRYHVGSFVYDSRLNTATMNPEWFRGDLTGYQGTTTAAPSNTAGGSGSGYATTAYGPLQQDMAPTPNAYGNEYGTTAPTPNAYGTTAAEYGTTANAYGTTAAGYGTTANAYGTTAAGYGTTADNAYGTTQANSYGTTANGYGTTEGNAYGTTAAGYGTDTTAADYGTTAAAYGTTPAGYGTTANAYGTTAAAYGTTAAGYGTTAGNAYGTTAAGYGTTAAGYGTTPNDYGTTAGKAYGTTANEYGTTAGNAYGTTAAGYGTTEAAYGTTAGNAYGTTAAGYGTTPNTYGTTEGNAYGTTADAYGTTAAGYGTTANAYGTTAGDAYGTTAAAYGTTANAYGTTAAAYGTTARGYGTTANAYGTTAAGYGTTAAGYGTTSNAYGTTPAAYGTTAAYGYLSTTTNTAETNFNNAVYDLLADQYGAQACTPEGRKELVRSWARMECEFLNSGDRTCVRPKYYDDCSDMPRNGNGYAAYDDIDVTLDDLIAKVSDYPCMVATRKRRFGWAAQFGTLWRLCRGDYDVFCDDEFLHNEESDACLDKVDDAVYGFSPIKDHHDGMNDGRFNQLEMMVMNAVIHGMIFIVIIATALIIGVCWKKMKKNGIYNKVKYVDDIENNSN